MSAKPVTPRFSRTLALLPPAVALAASHANAAADYFLKIEGIKGESTDQQHKDWIDIQSFSWGVSNAVDGTGGTTGRSTPSPLVISKPIDKSSPLLFLSACVGEKVPSITLQLLRAGGDGGQEVYYTIVMHDVLVTSMQSGGSSGGDSVPTESISFNYSKIEFEYKPRATNEEPIKVDFAWDKVAAAE